MPGRDRSPHSMTRTASPGSSTWSVTMMLSTPGHVSSCGGAGSRLTTRTSLPRWRRAYAMAIDEPIASPSGRACDVTTKRCRRRIASTMCRRSVGVEITVYTPQRLARRRVGFRVRILGRVGDGRRLALLVFVVQLAQDLLDAILMGHRFIELELQLRHAAQLQAVADMAAEEAGGALQRLRRLAAGRFVTQGRVVDARLLQVRRDLHAGQGDEADSRVVHFTPAQQFAQHLSDLVADAIGAMRSHALHRYGDSLHREHFDDVANLEVVVIRKADAAFEARLHLADVVLEAAERRNLAFVDDDVVTQQTRLGFA